MIDVPLLRKALEHVSAHPEEWDQRYWGLRGRTPRCGTSFCLAGHVVSLSGASLRWSGQFLVEADGGYVGDTASRLLGLDPARADLLFATTNTLPRLWALAWAFSGGEIEVPESLPAGQARKGTLLRRTQ